MTTRMPWPTPYGVASSMPGRRARLRRVVVLFMEPWRYCFLDQADGLPRRFSLERREQAQDHLRIARLLEKVMKSRQLRQHDVGLSGPFAGDRDQHRRQV